MPVTSHSQAMCNSAMQGGLVDAAALGFDKTVLDLVAGAQTVAAADLVGLVQQRRRAGDGDGDGGPTRQGQCLVVPQRVQQCRHGFHIHRVGSFALPTQQCRLVAAVALASGAQAAVQRAGQPGDAAQLPKTCPSRCTNSRAARIGATVWLLLGPMPTLNRSKVETAMAAAGGGSGRVGVVADGDAAACQVAVAPDVVDPAHR